jgi:NADH:ubiquinone oxidoreductase subunit
MGFFSKLFTWWDGATIGTSLFSARYGEKVGTDAQGNTYFRSPKRKTTEGREKRWVIYHGANDASRVPPEWHGWLHGAFDELPESHLPPAKIWEVEHSPNVTGTAAAYRPQGALEKGGRRARAHADYQAWTPDA